jgi:hypothetical protein
METNQDDNSRQVPEGESEPKETINELVCK